MIQDRDEAISQIEDVLMGLTRQKGSGVEFVEGCMWMTIFEEISFMATTWHGKPLHEERAPAGVKHPFPWRGVGYLRLRRYRVTETQGPDVPSAVPGTADLTFKMKKVDPEVGAGDLAMPKAVGPSKLTAKVENDIHCDHQRDTMSPLYRPVPPGLNISTPGAVKAYFPNLAKVALLDDKDRLPYLHTVHRAKIVWKVMFEGVQGEANLVIKYNTSYQDAVDGARPKNGEISLRIRRKDAGPQPEEKMLRALKAVADACQAFRDAGWDGKTGH